MEIEEPLEMVKQVGIFLAEVEESIKAKKEEEAELVLLISKRKEELEMIEPKLAEKKAQAKDQLDNFRGEQQKIISELRIKTDEEIKSLKASAKAETEKFALLLGESQCQVATLTKEIEKKQKLLAELNQSIEGIKARLG